MNQNLTELICIVDRSGSMSTIRHDAIGGFNSFVEGQREVPGEVRLSLALFDNEYDLVFDQIELSEVPLLTTETFVPRGSTALLDAIGKTIDDVGLRLSKASEADRPCKVIVSVLTDGEENSSLHHNLAGVSKRIARQQNKYGWEFVFLAANQDAIASAASLSIKSADAVAFAATSDGTREGWQKMTHNVQQKRRRSQ